jgi:hypothetical protein
MMEWNDIGIKDADDVRTCIAAGATVAELEALFGDRLAALLDEAAAENMDEQCKTRLLVGQ